MLPPVSSVTSTFAGFTSRWTSPRAWAASRAAATCPTSSSARSDRAAPLVRAGREIRALDVAHRDVETPVGLARLVHGHDVRVVEARRELGLDEEALAEALVLCALGRDELQGDRPPQPRVERPVDDAHAAATDDRFDRVTRELVAGAQLFGSDGCCQSVRVGRRVREGNLPGRTAPASGSSRIHAREDRRPR